MILIVWAESQSGIRLQAHKPLISDLNLRLATGIANQISEFRWRIGLHNLPAYTDFLVVYWFHLTSHFPVVMVTASDDLKQPSTLLTLYVAKVEVVIRKPGSHANRPQLTSSQTAYTTVVASLHHKWVYLELNRQPHADAKRCLVRRYQMLLAVTKHHYLMTWAENGLRKSFPHCWTHLELFCHVVVLPWVTDFYSGRIEKIHSRIRIYGAELEKFAYKNSTAISHQGWLTCLNSNISLKKKKKKISLNVFGSLWSALRKRKYLLRLYVFDGPCSPRTEPVRTSRLDTLHFNVQNVYGRCFSESPVPSTHVRSRNLPVDKSRRQFV